jgi:hypothetical protein
MKVSTMTFSPIDTAFYAGRPICGDGSAVPVPSQTEADAFQWTALWYVCFG